MTTHNTVGQQAAVQRCSQLAQCTSWISASPRVIWDSGLTCSFLASLIFSFSGLFVKLTAGRVPVLEVCLVRSSISLGLSFILMHVCGMRWQLFFGKRENLKLLTLRGCGGACSMTTYYVALFMLPLGDAVTINLIGPPVTAIFARVFLKEPLGRRGALGCLISLAGVVLVARPPFLFGGHEQWAKTRSIGTAAGMISAVLGGGSSMTIRLIGGSEPAAVIAIWFHTATTLLSVFPLLAGVPNKPVLLSGVDGSLMLGVAATSFVAQLLSTRGLQRCQAAKAAAMGFTQVVYSNIMGAVFFGDKLTLAGLWGALLILSGVLLVTWRPTLGKDSTKKDAAACADQAAATVAARASASFSKGVDNPAAALLPSGHIPSHLAAVAAEAKLPGEEDSEEAVVLVKLVADGREVPGKHTAGGFKDESEQLLADKTGLASPHDAAPAAGDVDEDEVSADAIEPTLLAQIAASAAAALGGELCPAGSTAAALELSRQVSVQVASSRVMSQMSRQTSQMLFGQPSQFLFGSPSAFIMAPGLALPLERPMQQQQRQPPQQQQPQEEEDRAVANPQQQQQQWGNSSEVQAGSPVLRHTLKQALLCDESLPSSPGSSSSTPHGQPATNGHHGED